MPDKATIDRRTVLRSTGAIAVTSIFAGCSSNGDNKSTEESIPSSVQNWLKNANYDSVSDMTESTTITVKVGARDGLSFAPAVVQISPGTEVVWEWTGEGGRHNVVAQDESFRSGNPVSEPRTTFKQTFEETATIRYYCAPHKEAGMKGALIIE